MDSLDFFDPKTQKYITVDDEYDDQGNSLILPLAQKEGLTPGFWASNPSSGEEAFIPYDQEQMESSRQAGFIPLKEQALQQDIKEDQEKRAQEFSSPLKAGAVSFGNAATAGLLPKAISAGQAAGDSISSMVKGEENSPSFIENFKRHNQNNTEIIDELNEVNPTTSTLSGLAGAVGAGIATGGGSLLREALTGGLFSGIDTATNSKKEGWDKAEEVAENALVGGAMPTALRGVGRVGKDIYEEIARNPYLRSLLPAAEEVGEKSATLLERTRDYLTKQVGMTGEEAQKYIDDYKFRADPVGDVEFKNMEGELQQLADKLNTSSEGFKNTIGKAYEKKIAQGIEDSTFNLDQDSPELLDLVSNLKEQRKFLKQVGTFDDKTQKLLKKTTNLLKPNKKHSPDPEEVVEKLLTAKRRSSKILRKGTTGDTISDRALKEYDDTIKDFLRKTLDGSDSFREADEIYSEAIDIPNRLLKKVQMRDAVNKTQKVTPEKLHTALMGGKTKTIRKNATKAMQQMEAFNKKFPEFTENLGSKWGEYQANFNEFKLLLDEFHHKVKVGKNLKSMAPFESLNAVIENTPANSIIPTKAMLNLWLSARNVLSATSNPMSQGLKKSLDGLISRAGFIQQEMRKENTKSHLKHRSSQFKRYMDQKYQEIKDAS